MKKTFLQMIDEDTENLRSGKSKLEADPNFVTVPDDHWAAKTARGNSRGDSASKKNEVAQTLVNVQISKKAFAQISKLAKKRKKGVGEIIEEKFVGMRA